MMPLLSEPQCCQLTTALFLSQPDIAAPGVSILAAREDEYALGTGTSMATPHVAGIVALLKALHPNWSPAALKSAIMTTGKSSGNMFMF